MGRFGQQIGPQTTGRGFRGSTAEMNGNVFQCFNEGDTRNQFTKTVEALAGYIAKNLKFHGDLTPLVKDLTEPTIEMPDDLTPDEEDSPLLKALWNKKVDAYSKRLSYLDSNLKTVYSVIWGQCSETMKAKLKAHDDFEA